MEVREVWGPPLGRTKGVDDLELSQGAWVKVAQCLEGSAVEMGEEWVMD